MKSKSPTCETCRFWKRMILLEKKPKLGICQRFPPTMECEEIDREPGEPRCIWPDTYEHAWCGEHQPLLKRPAR